MTPPASRILKNAVFLLVQITSVEDLDAKMAALGSAGKIDPAFLQVRPLAANTSVDVDVTNPSFLHTAPGLASIAASI